MNREKLANKVSDIFNPLHTSPVFLFLISFHAAETVVKAIIYWAITSLFLSFLPLLDVRRRVQTGQVSDPHITKREDRIMPFLVALLSAAGGLIAVYALNMPALMKAVVWSVVACGGLITLITTRWKISLHAAGITAIAVTLIIIFGLNALPVALLVPVVFWARFSLKKHTLMQLIAGSALAVAVACSTFKAFNLL